MRSFVKVKAELRPMGSGKNKEDTWVIYPEFNIGSDIMKKGGNFYAVLDQKQGMWSTDISDVYRIIDEKLYSYVEEHFEKDGYGTYRDPKGHGVFVKTIDNSTTKVLIEFNKWLSNLPPNKNYIPLDSSLTFLSDEVTYDMYRSKRLPYDLKEGSIEAYEEIVSTLYSPENREKIEWSIGAVLSGDSKKIEKFIVLYGKGGSGKSTILDLIEKIFDGYWSVFVAEELALKSHQFATASFKDNPLVAIQDDGSLKKIDSPRINEIVSHKPLQINEKNTKQYSLKPQAMLFLATNDKIDMHDTNLGITRRLLDVYPSGNLIPVREYRQLVHQMMEFEIPAIAKHCYDVYIKLGKEYYSKYIPEKMIEKTNYLYNFMFDKADQLIENDPITRDVVYGWYKDYFEESGFGYPPKRIDFGEQIKEYYEKYDEVKWLNGRTHRHVYSGFKKNAFMDTYKVGEDKETWLKFDCKRSLFDEWCKDKGFKAQYANDKGNPKLPWSKVTTTLNDIDTSKLHWILIPESESYIRIDFDLKDENGEKSLEKNIEAASSFPKTYAEISKSGGGVHLHYFYDGDTGKLDGLYSDDIEIKVCKGNSALRRKLTKCNDIPAATISSGLPLKKQKKGDKDVVNEFAIKNERHLKNSVAKALRKEGKLNSTTVACNYIYKVVEEESYKKGLSYDIRDMEGDVRAFANNSTHNAAACTKLMAKVHFCSDDMVKDTGEVGTEDNKKPIAFFDVEVFPNVFILCWKMQGDSTIWRLINPRPEDVIFLIENYRLIGFNNRRYDNHIIYAWAYKGYTNYELFILSQSIINAKKGSSSNAFFGGAYNLSYLDIYDLASNPNKMGLKKWEIKLHAHHQENSYAWDKDLPEDKWQEVCDYCCNDVKSTELVYDAIAGDVAARLILSMISGLLPNATTNNHSMQIIFGDNEHPQSEFIYTDLSKLFPGYKYDAGKSTYMGEEVGEGGYVYAEPGVYYNVALLDIASMHPSSIEALNLFGDLYTKRFSEIKNARIAIKHQDRKALETLLDGKLLEFYDIGLEGKQFTLKDLSNALKTVINSVYGLTAASFDNRCRDPRNVDNIVAKRGALFMVNLKHEVQKRGFTVAHIKTDSIKIPNATPEIISFVMEYGKKFGYTFEHEATYKKMCLVNDAVYIAQYDDGPHEFELSTGEKIMTDWTATGAEFQHPYIFKKLFSGHEINIDDMSETKSVGKGELYLDFNEGLSDDEHNYVFVGKVSAFLPVKDGVGGAELFRVQDDKYYAVSGTKGKRWMETEFIRNNNLEDYIDMSYYDKLCDDAIAHINEFGSFECFMKDEIDWAKIINVPEGVDEEVPFDEDKVLTVT